MSAARTLHLPLLFKQPAFCAFKSPSVQHASISIRGIRMQAKAARAATKRQPRFTKPPRPSRQAVEEEEAERSDPSGINFFEVDGHMPNAKRRRISNPDDDLAPIQKEIEDLDENIEFFKEEVKNAKPPSEATEEEAQEFFTKEELERIEANMIEDLAKRDGTAGEDPFELMPHAIKAPEELSAAGRIFLAKLNDSLNDASMDASNLEASKLLWRYYERGKIYIPGLIDMLPEPAWQLLWISQSEDSMDNPHRASHLKIITQDMLRAGKTLTEEQRLARIEGVFRDGKEAEALEMWEAGLKSGWAGNREFLEMGVRMYAEARNLVRAREVVDALFGLHSDADPRILLGLVQASIKIGTEDGLNQAWGFYSHLRKRLGGDVTMEDFDIISLDFLAAGRKDHAFAVFRDMMLLGEERMAASVWHGAVQRLTSFMGTASNANEVNSIGLESLTMVPRRWQNKFFYASWLKKLIGMGELKAASQVIDLMYERRIRPDAKHVNGLVSAWLNGVSKADQRQAEQIAWTMIQNRIEFVEQRQAGAEKALHRSVYETSGLESEDAEDEFEPIEKPEIPRVDKTRPLPLATIETFCILVQYYLRRANFANARHLQSMLTYCGIPMNSYFMNHLLNAELRFRHYRAMYLRFNAMSATVTPDTETFAILWDCMEDHVNPVFNVRGPAGFPSPPTLLKNMLTWYGGLRGRQLREASEEVSLDLYNDILRCFWLLKDMPGGFVAMHLLRRTFGLSPDENTMRTLITYVASLPQPMPKTRNQARKKLSVTKQIEDNIEKTTQVLGAITQVREQAYREHGLDVDDLSDEQREEEQHRTALQLMYTVVQQTVAKDNEAAIENAILEAARKMGVEKLDVNETMGLVL